MIEEHALAKLCRTVCCLKAEKGPQLSLSRFVSARKPIFPLTDGTRQGFSDNRVLTKIFGTVREEAKHRWGIVRSGNCHAVFASQISPGWPNQGAGHRQRTPGG
jgi:hypothetical protein